MDFNSKKSWSCTLVTLCLLALIGPAHAQVLFDNFGPGDTYQTNIGWTISSAGSIVGASAQGEQFIPSLTASLDSIDIAMGLVVGQNHFDLDLLDDAAGFPGGLIESFSVDN